MSTQFGPEGPPNILSDDNVEEAVTKSGKNRNQCFNIYYPRKWEDRCIPITSFIICFIICVILFIVSLLANFSFLDVGYSCQCNKHYEGLVLDKRQNLFNDINQAKCTYVSQFTNETLTVCYREDCNDRVVCNICITENVPKDKECQKKHASIIAPIILPIIFIIILCIILTCLCICCHCLEPSENKQMSIYRPIILSLVVFILLPIITLYIVLIPTLNAMGMLIFIGVPTVTLLVITCLYKSFTWQSCIFWIENK